MKQTSRDWLLARHADVVPALDALRKAALPEPRLSGREFLRELFRPALPVWAMIAVVWIAILVTNAAQSPRFTPTRPVPQFAATWSNSNAQLNALLEETRALR